VSHWGRRVPPRKVLGPEKKGKRKKQVSNLKKVVYDMNLGYFGLAWGGGRETSEPRLSPYSYLKVFVEVK